MASEETDAFFVDFDKIKSIICYTKHTFYT